MVRDFAQSPPPLRKGFINAPQGVGWRLGQPTRRAARCKFISNGQLLGSG